MKKFSALIVLLLVLSASAAAVNAAERPLLGEIESTSKQLTESEYGYKNVRKNYTPYLVAVLNNNPVPVVITAKTNIEFVSADGPVTPSDSRRNIYRKSNRVLRGFKCLPEAAITEKSLPLRFEPGQIYNIRVFAPADVVKPVAVNITNVTFDRKTLCDIKVPLANVEEL